MSSGIRFTTDACTENNLSGSIQTGEKNETRKCCKRHKKCEVTKCVNGPLLQHSCLENPMDGGAWWAAIHGVAESWTRVSDFTFSFHFHALEKEMATHSSVLAWRFPGTAEPGGLPSMGSHRVGHDCSDLAAAAAVRSVLGRKVVVPRKQPQSQKEV